jgi:putative phosphoesterase
MKKVVVLSDTHGNFSAIDKILPIMEESDYVFHLGDYERDILSYSKELKNKIYSVKGNCDGGGEEQVLEVEGVKIMLVHGDRYGVKGTLTNLFYRAKELNVNAVFYGHTHVSSIDEVDGIKFINPGSMNKFSQNSYCYVVIYNGKITEKIVLL